MAQAFITGGSGFIGQALVRRLLGEGHSARVPRFVHCGSEAALLAGDPLVDVDETAPLRPDSEAAYCAVKAISEKIVLDANAPGFATVSIRPRFVWGPGRSPITDALVPAAKAGQFAWIGGARHTTDVTFVDNVVEGFMLGWQRGRPEAYFVTDQHPVVLREFLGTLFEIYGVDTPIPDLDAEIAAREVPVPFRWFVGQTCTLRTDKAVAELGYKPIVSHAAGLDAVRNSVAATAGNDPNMLLAHFNR